MSRPIIALMLFLLVFGVTAGYHDRSSDPKDGVVHITYWTGWSGHELDLQQKIVDEFNRTHPKIHVRMVTVCNSYQKVKIAFATGAVPDVCSAVWSSELAGYACRGVLAPLDDYMKTSGRSGDEFMPGIWKSLHYNGRLYALCTTNNSAFLAYNKKVFRECGLDPNNPPHTIDQLDKAVSAVTQYDSHGDFLRYGFRPTWLENWAYAFGGRWYDEKTGKVTANDPRNVECLRWMASYSRKYDINKMQTFEQSFGNQMSENASFFTGKQIVWVTGEYVRRFTEKYAPDLEWGICPLPNPPGGRTDFAPVGGSVFVVPTACKHKKEAWEFLSWICSPKASKQFCLGISCLSPLRAVSAEPEFREDPVLSLGQALSEGPNAMGAVPIPIWAEYQQEIGRVEDYAVHGKEDPQKLLDDLTIRMQDELDKLRKGY